MAEIEGAIFTRLTTFPALAALVVKAGATRPQDRKRVYPLRVPQDPMLPAVTYQRIGGPRFRSLHGSIGYVEQRMQVDTWATTYSSAKAVAKQVRLALDGWHSHSSSPLVESCALERDTDLDEDEVDNYRVSQDYLVIHAEEVA